MSVDVSLLQANGVRATRRVVDGGACRLSHSPFIPDLLSIVTPPEPHAHIIATGQRDRLLHGGEREREGKKGVRIILPTWLYTSAH